MDLMRNLFQIERGGGGGLIEIKNGKKNKKTYKI